MRHIVHPVKPAAPDFTVANHGSLFLVTPRLEVHRAHLQYNVDGEAQWFGNALAVEHRYIDGLVLALREDGYTVR